MWPGGFEPSAFSALWQCSWIDTILERASQIQLALDGSHGRDRYPSRRSCDDYATLMFMKTPNDEKPVFRMTLDESIRSVEEDKDYKPYLMLYDTLTHCLRHRASSMVITGLGPRKPLPPSDILGPVLMQCPDLTSLTVINCHADSLIHVLRSVDLADAAIPGLRE